MSIVILRTYAVERLKPCRGRGIPAPIRPMNRATTIEIPSGVRREQRSLFPTEMRKSYILSNTDFVADNTVSANAVIIGNLP